jgi:hypothetical protein
MHFAPAFKYSAQNVVFTHRLHACPSHNVRDQLSYPYKTTGKVIALYVLIFVFLDRHTGRDKVLNRMTSIILTIIIHPLIILIATIQLFCLVCYTFGLTVYSS